MTLFLSIVILTLCIPIIIVVPAIADDVDGFQIFPLPILDILPSENRFFYPNWDKCCKGISGIFGEQVVENPYIIKLPNGFNLTVSDWGNNNKSIDNQFSLLEDTIFVENRDGIKKAIAAGQGWGDPMQTLILDNKNGRIFIRESQGVNKRWGEMTTREYDLKCTDTECFFYKERDCLLKIEDVDEPSKILKDLENAAVQIDDFIGNVDNLDIVFKPALSGKKENIELFFDTKKWGKYVYIDGKIHTGVHEIHSANVRFLLEYGPQCFKDSGIDWEKYAK